MALHDLRFFVVVSTSKTPSVFIFKHAWVSLRCTRTMVIGHRMGTWHPPVFLIRELQHEVGPFDSLIAGLLPAVMLLLHLIAAALVRRNAAKVRRLIQLLP